MAEDNPINPEKGARSVKYEKSHEDDFFLVIPPSFVWPDTSSDRVVIENYDPSASESVEYSAPEIIEDYNPGINE
jgi:hypothetical protein